MAARVSISKPAPSLQSWKPSGANCSAAIIGLWPLIRGPFCGVSASQHFQLAMHPSSFKLRHRVAPPRPGLRQYSDHGAANVTRPVSPRLSWHALICTLAALWCLAHRFDRFRWLDDLLRCCIANKTQHSIASSVVSAMRVSGSHPLGKSRQLGPQTSGIAD